MVIFNSYVKLPEGIPYDRCDNLTNHSQPWRPLEKHPRAKRPTIQNKFDRDRTLISLTVNYVFYREIIPFDSLHLGE